MPTDEKTIKMAAAGKRDPDTTVDVELGDKTGVVTTESLNIKTLEQALKVSDVDLEVWEVERHTVNFWTVTVSGKRSSTKKDQTYTNYQVKVWLRRKSPSILELSLEKLIERFPLSPLKIKPARKLDDKSWRFLLEMALYDAHFSLMAWGRETGTDYDLKTAEAGWMDAGEDLLAKTSGCKPDKILFPIGNDFLHINNPEGLTPMSHNILDVDGRFCKIMETAERSLIRMIDRCVQVAPVHLLWVPGNHDPQTSYYLCRVLKAHYRLNARVFVDVEPPPRKYFHWGVNLIGFTHGNEEKFGDLPTLLASENRAIWHQVRHCEFHVGHRHVAKEMRFSAGDTLGGIRIRTIPSISGTDAWHFKKGYVQGGRMAEAFLFDRHAGLVANYTSRNLRYPKPEITK